MSSPSRCCSSPSMTYSGNCFMSRSSNNELRSDALSVAIITLFIISSVFVLSKNIIFSTL